MERVCKECGISIAGRSDKIFCSDACRNAFNNTASKLAKVEIDSVNKKLRKNLKILKDLSNCGKRRVSGEELSSLGFDFRYVTSFKKRGDGRVVMHCYNYSYINSSNGSDYITKKNN